MRVNLSLKKFRLSWAFAVIAWLPQSAWANSACYDVNAAFSQEEFTQNIDLQSQPVRDAYGIYEQMRAMPEMEALFPRDTIYRLMDQPASEFLIHNFKSIMDRVRADQSQATLIEKFRAAAREHLRDRVPASQLEERINALGDQSPAAIERALGYMTVQETNLLLHGGNPQQPTADSLIGKYIAETGAQTVVRTFGQNLVNRAPDPNGPQGEARLVVAVGPNSLEVFKKYFNRPELMYHAHGRGQGTLYVSHLGQSGSYSQVQRSGADTRLSDGAIWPTIVMSTSEGGRARAYFDIAVSGSQASKTPWSLEGYCAKGGYSSCTHWWGEMPIGDRRVNELVFPGKIDQYASTSISNDPVIDAQPRRQPLAQYQIPANTPRDAARRINRLFTYPQAGEQLAVMVGTEAQLVAGEWANPGYVAVSLVSRSTTERVPVVFYNVQDHRTPIQANFDTGISAY
jgi:hypothetical protein